MRLAQVIKLLATVCAAHTLCGPAGAATPALASTSDYTLALSSTGKVYAWGWDTRGQLGSGRTLFRATAQKIAGLPPIAHMEAGKVHAAAADSSGNVWTWGQDTSGQLGPRTGKDWTRPLRVVGITGVIQVAASQSFTAALRNDGTVWVWGSFAQLLFRTPQQVPGFSGITAISAGGGHIIARKSDGTVWTAGTNDFGELGDGNSGNVRTAAFLVPIPGTPSPVTKVASGQCSSVTLHANGTVNAWGRASCTTTPPRYSPAAVTIGAGVVTDIYGGFHNSHAVMSDGTVRSWDNAYTPAVRSGLTGISQVVVDSLFETVARRTNGTVAVSGANEVGQLGLGHANPLGGVSTVVGLTGITRVATVVSGNGGTTNFALAGNGDLYAWGSDFEGQLGTGSTLLTSVPKEVAGLPAIEKIGAGELAAYAVDATGNVWAWGDNFGYALGDTTNTPRSTPVMVAGITGVKDVAAGRRYVLFLMNDGTVRELGDILGIGGYAPPAAIPGLTGIASVAVHQQNAFAIRTSATPAVYSWGRGSLGLLGDNTTADRTTPGLITTFTSTVTHVAVGQFHALARSVDGAVWSWGSDFSYGVLGDGDPSSHARLVPARIAGVAGATHVAAGYDHSLARLASGQVLSWGLTALGDGANESRNVPGPVRTLATAALVSAGYYSSHALGSDGVVTAWGGRPLRTTQYSTFGASTGDGTFVYRTAPVLVLRDGAQGNLDNGDWYLDLNTAANSIPAALLPKVVPVAKATITPTVVSLEAGINFRAADNGKKVKIFILGYVPPAFLAQAGVATGMSKARVDELVKAGGEILVQLTPSGWLTVEGQLVAYATGVVAGNGGANNILNGVPLSSIPGATFCIGYGEDGASMLSAGTLGDVLALEGAASSASGLPCVLSGIYVDGPASSIAGSAVTFNASVVGFAPTGTVQFKDNLANLGAPAALAASNAAVSKASVITSSLGAGPHSIAASYPSDGPNPAANTDIALAHQVNAAPPGTASVALSGPVSSEAGSDAVFSVVVTGNNPGGAVQFRDGAANLGAPEPLVGGTATLRVSTLALGPHSIDAAYGGDVGNGPAISNFVSHVVYAAINTSVSLASSANPAAYGAVVTLTAAVSGSNPTGNVTFRNGAVAFASNVALSGGVATTTVASLAPGAHVITASYLGDGGANQAVTSPGLYQQVNAQTPNTAPSPFGFAQQLNVTPGSVRTSSTTVVSGLGATVPITIVGGSYSIGCGAAPTFVFVAGTITNGQSVCVRHTAAASNSTTTYTTLTIGGVSATFTSTTYPATFLASVSATVAHYYQAILGRAPDAGGAAFWQAEALRVSGLGASVNEALYSLAATFFVSAEYAAFNRNNTGFATDLYNTFFDRLPDSGGLAFWVGQLDQGLPREVALASFMFSAEFAAYTQALFGTTDARAEVITVMDFYRGLLARLPDDGGLAFWVGRFRTAQCQGQAAVINEVEAISSAFALSSEYVARGRSNAQYVGDLYNAFLRRGGDLAGVNFWIGQIVIGAQTREQARVQFKNSPEFQGRVNAIIAQGCL